MDQQVLLENDSNAFSIPMWEDLRRVYDAKWEEEKEKFHNQLKENFRALIGQYKSGKQEIYELSETTYAKHYEKAFRELFSDTGYQATVGEVERLGTGNKKSKKLYVTLPICYN
jgi:hypothetical protein